jgi:hypothetical protein
MLVAFHENVGIDMFSSSFKQLQCKFLIGDSAGCFAHFLLKLGFIYLRLNVSYTQVINRRIWISIFQKLPVVQADHANTDLRG